MALTFAPWLKKTATFKFGGLEVVTRVTSCQAWRKTDNNNNNNNKKKKKKKNNNNNNISKLYWATLPQKVCFFSHVSQEGISSFHQETLVVSAIHIHSSWLLILEGFGTLHKGYQRWTQTWKSYDLWCCFGSRCVGNVGVTSWLLKISFGRVGGIPHRVVCVDPNGTTISTKINEVFRERNNNKHI